jgi:transcriptional regulator with XRE-family HTH domain
MFRYYRYTVNVQQKTTAHPENTPYPRAMARKLSKPRPSQGSHLATLRKATGLTQTELAKLVDEPQTNIAFWETSDKPPRSDAIPKLARVLGVSVETILSPDAAPVRHQGPVTRAQRVFSDVSRLPRRQQVKVLDIIEAVVQQYKKKAS